MSKAEAIATATPESSSSKRESMDAGSHHRQPKQQKKRHKKQKNSKNNHHHTTRKRWIETCSETILHIPAKCLAPLTCVVTRIEIDPKNDAIAGTTKTAVSVEVSSKINGNENISNIARPSSLLTQYANEKKLSSMTTTQINTDVEDERQKVFIPVKRHSSAIGQSKVSKLCNIIFSSHMSLMCDSDSDLFLCSV